MEKTTNILFIHLPSFIFLLSILSEKQKTVGGEKKKKKFKTQIFTQLSQIFIYQNVEQSNILHFCFHG